MTDFEVEKVLNKRTNGKKEEYLLKWRGLKRPSWIKKDNLNCSKFVLEFEKSRCPEILGVKRESGDIRYLVNFAGERGPKLLTSLNAQMFAVGIIDFLQAKIVWEEEGSGSGAAQARGNTSLVEPRNGDCKVIYAAQVREGISYFFEYGNGDVALMAAGDAIYSHSQLVLKYLEDCVV